MSELFIEFLCVIYGPEGVGVINVTRALSLPSAVALAYCPPTL